MTTRERIQVELNQMSEDELNSLYNVLYLFRQSRRPDLTEQSPMEALRAIKIHAPADFSTNWERYLGEEDSDADSDSSH